MAGATSKLSILIDAKNNASPVLKDVASDAGSMGKVLSGIAGAFGLAFSAQAIAGIAEAGFEMAKASAEAERLATSFNSLAASAGQSGDAMLDAMRTAAQGTISDTDLMLAANKAMMLGVADSADEMAQLLEIAAARGKAMGESTSQAFSDLVTGLGRQSVLILDNLGITVDAAKANEAYAESLGRTSDSLTDAEKKQALLNAVIKDSTDIVQENQAAGMDAAANFERMDAAIQNAKDALGTLFEPAMVVVAQAIADAAVAATTEMKALTAESVQQRTDVAILDQAMIGLTNDIGQLEQGMRRLEAAGQTGSDAYKQAATELARLKQQVNETRDAHNSLIPSIELASQDFTTISMTANQARAALAAAGDQALDTGSKLRVMGADALAAMEQFNMAMATSQSIMSEIGSAATQAGVLFAGKQGGDAGLSKQKAVTEELQSQVKVWKEQGYTEKEINDVLLPGMVQSLNEADRATFKVASGTAKISDEAREAQQAFDDLTNTVAGVLSGALDPGVGVDPSDILPREDAINEDARRLADVAVNGWASPWAEYFRTAFPEQFQEMAASSDIKQGAALMLRNFQDGLEPELINKEEAKERVRKMLIGDQNMAALATEIATELAAEMGIPMQEALAAAQGTLGGGTGMGTEAATTFADSASQALDEGNGGGSFVTKFTDQMKASYGLLSQAGKDAGKLWGANFLEVVGENVPPALVKILVELTTPGVIAALAQKGSLTGATP